MKYFQSITILSLLLFLTGGVVLGQALAGADRFQVKCEVRDDKKGEVVLSPGDTFSKEGKMEWIAEWFSTVKEPQKDFRMYVTYWGETGLTYLQISDNERNIQASSFKEDPDLLTVRLGSDDYSVSASCTFEAVEEEKENKVGF